MTDLQHAIDMLAPARRIAVLSGAGMSAESGIPTFRGSHDSLWSRFDPMRLATADAWREDAALVWAWYRWRIALVADAQPHAGHRALVALARTRRVDVVTQNVDDLHERAGSMVQAHVHGSLLALRCFDCAQPHGAPLDAMVAADVPQRLAPPRCLHCGGQVRPGVVWFGEALPQQPWTNAQQAMQDCDALLVVGTSGLVQPAASLPALAHRRGVPVLEINPEPAGLARDPRLRFAASAAQLLPSLADQLC